MSRKRILAFCLGAGLVAAVVTGLQLRVDVGYAVLGFVVAGLGAALTGGIIWDRLGAGFVFLDVVLLGFYAYFAVRYMATPGTLLGVLLGAFFGALFYLGWLREPRGAPPPGGGQSEQD